MKYRSYNFKARVVYELKIKVKFDKVIKWFVLLLWSIRPWQKNFCWIQSYVIKSAPWTILWFRILGIFSVENIKRLCVFMFQTWDNSQLLRRVLWISAELTIGATFKHKCTQPLYMFNRVRVLHLNRLKERTWLYSFAFMYSKVKQKQKLGSFRVVFWL